jgi:hypothetical protein
MANDSDEDEQDQEQYEHWRELIGEEIAAEFEALKVSAVTIEEAAKIARGWIE